MLSLRPRGGKHTTVRPGRAGKWGPPAPVWGRQAALRIASIAPASKVTKLRMVDSSRAVAAILFQFSSDAGRRLAPRRFQDRLEHRNAVHFVAVGDGECASGHRGLREMLELCALGAGFGKSHDLRPAIQMKILPVDGTELQLPGGQVLDIPDLGPAVRAEDLQAPGLGGCGHGAEIAGRAA